MAELNGLSGAAVVADASAVLAKAVLTGSAESRRVREFKSHRYRLLPLPQRGFRRHGSRNCVGRWQIQANFDPEFVGLVFENGSGVNHAITLPDDGSVVAPGFRR